MFIYIYTDTQCVFIHRHVYLYLQEPSVYLYIDMFINIYKDTCLLIHLHMFINIYKDTCLLIFTKFINIYTHVIYKDINIYKDTCLYKDTSLFIFTKTQVYLYLQRHPMFIYT